MKRYTFDLGAWQADDIFAPIRTKARIIELLMKSVKLMIANQRIDAGNTIGSMHLVVSKMSRLFYVSEHKYVSIAFPFFAAESDGRLMFSSSHVLDIDSKITSQVLSVISSAEAFDAGSVLDFAEPIDEISGDTLGFWPFFRELLAYEDGYIRYDHDERHANGRLHPVDHYDVFYSSGATFKIGLKRRTDDESLIDFLRTETSCHFLE